MLGFSTQGVSTDDARKGGSVFGLVRRLSKRRAGSHQAGHQGRLTGVYADAIEINGGSMVAAGGYTTTFGLVGGTLVLYFFRHILGEAVLEGGGAYFFVAFTFLAAYAIFLLASISRCSAPPNSPSTSIGRGAGSTTCTAVRGGTSSSSAPRASKLA